MKNLDVVLGSHSRNGAGSQLSENDGNVDLMSGDGDRQHEANVNGEDFRTLLNTNSRGSSEFTAETVRMIKKREYLSSFK